MGCKGDKVAPVQCGLMCPPKCLIVPVFRTKLADAYPEEIAAQVMR